MATDNAEGALAQLRGGIWDLSGVVARKKNMNDPGFVLVWKSAVAQSTALGLQLVNEVTTASNESAARPEAFNVIRLEGETKNVGLAPTAKSTKGNVPARWVKNGTQLTINLTKLLTIWPFPMPRGTTAFVPIARAEVNGVGPCIILRFGEAEFSPIDERDEKSSSQSATQAAAAVAASK